MAYYSDMGVTEALNILQKRGRKISCSNVDFCPTHEVIKYIYKFWAETFNLPIRYITALVYAAIVFWGPWDI